MANKISQKWKTTVIILAIIAVGAGFTLQFFQQSELPLGIASGNGRIEANEVDIATKFGGRIAAVLVKEGDTVAVNQALVQIDTKEREAQLHRAEAEVLRARQERSFALAVIAQRESELLLAKKDLNRSKGLYENDSISLEQLQRDETAVQTAKATLAAAQAQLSNADAAIKAAIANTELIKVQIADSLLRAPINGRVLYRLVEPGEVLGAGGKVLTVVDPMDVSMKIFLPTHQAAKLAIGADARVVLDGIPDIVIPAKVSFVAPKAQFTPKEVETRTEREKLMFRIKVKILPEFLENNVEFTKSGVPGEAYVRLDSSAAWPDNLQHETTP